MIQESMREQIWKRDNLTKKIKEQPYYRIYSCISQLFTTKKSAPKIALDLYTSLTQLPEVHQENQFYLR